MTSPHEEPQSPATPTVPKAVISRLSLYLRELQRLDREGMQTVSSSQLGRLLGFSDAQVRKDLAHFGHFGHPGVGYRCREVVAVIRKIMGTDQQWNVALVGVGNLGRALLGYKRFSHQGFRIVAAFDVDPPKIATRVEGVPIYHTDELAGVVEREGIRLGMIAVPAAEAQAVADRLVAAGIEGIVSFAPVTIALPGGVSVVGVDLAIELEQISFSVANRSL